MRAVRVARLCALLVLALAPAACDVDCTDYTNRTLASGPVRDAADNALGTAMLGLYEQTERGERHILFTLDAPFGSGGVPLRGHVLGGQLISPAGEVILTIDPATPSPVMHGVINNYVPNLSEETMTRVREAMLTGRIRMVLETDLPGRERIESLLSGASHQPYVKRSCPRYS